MKRYFADRYDADGKFYVFDQSNAGSECAGPFDTYEEAARSANLLNNPVKRYDMAILITVDARSYEGAQGITEDIAAGLGDSQQIACSAPSYEHDNSGQRVLYLHPENETSVN